MAGDQNVRRSGVFVVVPTTDQPIILKKLAWSARVPVSRVVLATESSEVCEPWSTQYSNLLRPGEPLPPGWYVVNVAVEQLIPGILRGDPEEIYQYRERRAIALEWRRTWRRIRSGEDHGWVAGTFHLYRVPPPGPSPPGPLSRPLPPPAHRERGK